MDSDMQIHHIAGADTSKHENKKKISILAKWPKFPYKKNTTSKAVTFLNIL